jgi:hypothetical protein
MAFFMLQHVNEEISWDHKRINFAAHLVAAHEKEFSFNFAQSYLSEEILIQLELSKEQVGR